MKIALISPESTTMSRDKAFVNFYESNKEVTGHRQRFTGLSLGLLIIAALTPKSFEIQFIDENYDPVDFSKKYDLIGITAITQQATRAYQIADKFREKGITVVIGGIHATVLPEEVKEHADSVVIGEAEETWPQFIDDFINRNIKPFYRQTGLVDLTKSPIPRYDLLDPEKYKAVWIQTTRGCPHDCEFCAASRIYGSTYRYKTVDQIVDEMNYIKSIFGKVWINFADDNMFVNRKYSKELVTRLISFNLRWFAQTDISVAEDNELLGLLRKSGCVVLFIGLEAVSEEDLSSIDKHGWKRKHFEKYSEYIKKIQSYGIGVMGAFIVGLDSSNITVFEKIADFAVDNCLYSTQVTILTPLPGTRLRERLEQEDRILHSSWDNYTSFDVNFKPKQMTIQQLQSGLLDTYKKVHSKEAVLKRAKYFKEVYLKLT